VALGAYLEMLQESPIFIRCKPYGCFQKRWSLPIISSWACKINHLLKGYIRFLLFGGRPCAVLYARNMKDAARS